MLCFKNTMYFVALIVLLNCCKEQSNSKNILPPPPGEPKKYEIHYKGKTYEMNEEEHRQFLDSLKLNDTVIKKIS